MLRMPKVRADNACMRPVICWPTSRHDRHRRMRACLKRGVCLLAKMRRRCRCQQSRLDGVARSDLVRPLPLARLLVFQELRPQQHARWPSWIQTASAWRFHSMSASGDEAGSAPVCVSSSPSPSFSCWQAEHCCDKGRPLGQLWVLFSCSLAVPPPQLHAHSIWRNLPQIATPPGALYHHSQAQPEASIHQR